MQQNLLKFVQVCYKHSFNSRICQRVFSNLQHQVFQSDKKVEKVSSILTSYGFNQGQVNGILRSSEAICSYSDEDLILNLKIWLSFEVNDKLFTVLSAYPELLTLSPEYVKSREKELMTLFTKKDIHKLLVTCPNVFLDDFSTIYEKVEYIVYMMGVEQKSIVKSRALYHDLQHIKCRHMFLTRAGYYIVKKRAPKNRNPPLHKIFSRNIGAFLKIARLTEEEYNAFSTMYEEEILEEEYDSDDEIDF